MKSKLVPLIVVALVPLMLFGSVVPASALGGSKYNVTLKPTNVKNSKGTPITKGSGSGSVTVYPARGQICWSLTVQGIRLPATHAYVKSAKKGSVGVTVATLGAPGSSGSSSGCTRQGVSRSTLRAIQSSPSLYYVIIQTTDYPLGALRGRL